MNDLYIKLDKYFKFEKSDSVFVTIIKSLIILVSGAFLGLFLKEINSEPPIKNYWHLLIFLVGAIIFIYLEYRRLTKEKNFPISILNHLSATEDLKILTEKYNRKCKIYEYVDSSIQSLNSNTCPVIFTLPENLLCNQDIALGLKEVLNDLVERPNYFLDIDKTKFTVGVYIKYVETETETFFPDTKEKFIIFRDDLLIKDYIPTTLENLEADEISEFKIQTALIESLNFDKYICKHFEINDETYSIICSPIPNVCESCPPEGIIFTIYKGTDSCPIDIENILLIFGRIVSNWMAKYNECVRIGRAQKQTEVQAQKNAEKIENEVK